MNTIFFKRAIQDIFCNRFLNLVAILTIALSILTLSAFALFFVNANDIMNSWKKGIRIQAYLQPEVPPADRQEIQSKIEALDGVRDVRFISREAALKRLKEVMGRQSSILENLNDNPLPDAFEIHLTPASQDWEAIENLATRIESLPRVTEVEYGRGWLGRLSGIFDLFRVSGYALGGLFFMAAVFIVANTARLVLYTRREEIEIMRLVGASDRFIKAPFYIAGLLQGALGGLLGMAVLFLTFMVVTSNVENAFAIELFRIRFLSIDLACAIILGSMLVGWLGCYLSLRKYLKEY